VVGIIVLVRALALAAFGTIIRIEQAGVDVSPNVLVLERRRGGIEAEPCQFHRRITDALGILVDLLLLRIRGTGLEGALMGLVLILLFVQRNVGIKHAAEKGRRVARLIAR